MAFEIENEDVYFCEKVKAKVQDEFKKAEEFGDSGNIVNQLLHLSAAVNCVDLALLTTKLSSEDSSDFLKKRNDMKPLIDELKTRLKEKLDSQQSAKSNETKWTFDIETPITNIDDLVGQAKIKSSIELGFTGGKKFPTYSLQFAAEIIPKSYLLYGPPGMIS